MVPRLAKLRDFALDEFGPVPLITITSEKRTCRKGRLVELTGNMCKQVARPLAA
jgi:hypothetical protein